MLVNYIEIFSKDNLAVIVTCFTDKGWTVTWITKEFQAKSGISEASVGFLTMISSSCKTVLRHTVPKQLKIFFETTRPISSAHKNGAFARSESTRLLHLGHVARTSVRRKA